MISIVIPCHNQGKFLRTAVESCLVQSRGDHEIIIVDDASTDETPEVIKTIKNENPRRRIVSVSTGAQGGLSEARNLGIQANSGDYILPLDADDFLHPQYLEHTAVLLDNGEADIVATSRICFGTGVAKVNIRYISLGLFPLQNQIGYCSIFRRECWEKVGGYPKNYPEMGYEDWEFWIKCAASGFRFAAIDEYLWFYRFKATGMAQDALKNHQRLMSRIITRNPDSYLLQTVEHAVEILDND